MGRKPWSNRRIVEECRALNIADLVRLGLFSPWIASNGYRYKLLRTITWRGGFAVCATLPGRYVCGNFCPPSMSQDEIVLTYDTQWNEIEERIEIVSQASPVRPKARRYYFLCPGWDDAPCGERVGKLYLPRNEDHFRCRACHDLTYRSVKGHDKRVDAFIRSPSQLKEMLNSKDPRKMNVALRGIARIIKSSYRMESQLNHVK